jgi:hypothetical protein
MAAVERDREHEFAEARVSELIVHEEVVRVRERERVLAPMRPAEPREDPTGFCPGGVI